MTLAWHGRRGVKLRVHILNCKPEAEFETRKQIDTTKTQISPPVQSFLQQGLILTFHKLPKIALLTVFSFPSQCRHFFHLNPHKALVFKLFFTISKSTHI